MQRIFELFDHYWQTAEYEEVPMPTEMKMQWDQLGDVISRLIEETVNAATQNAERWGFYHGMRYAMRLMKDFGILLPIEDRSKEPRLELRAGSSYHRQGWTYRILGIQDTSVLLEEWSKDGKLIQYIVTTGLFLDNSELHWKGSGAYFPCMYPPPTSDTPMVALGKALDYMRGPRKVYLLTAETDAGAWAKVFPSMTSAKAALQKALDNNDNIQTAASALGIDKLEVDDYLKGPKDKFREFVDWYTIEEQELDS